jgi:hypothetical protein
MKLQCKKKIKFSSYIRKFSRDRVQNHVWLTASSFMVKYLHISSYIRKPFLIFDRSHLNLLIYEENFLLFFISVANTICRDLVNILQTFGLAIRRKCIASSSDDICLPIYLLFYFMVNELSGSWCLFIYMGKRWGKTFPAAVSVATRCYLSTASLHLIGANSGTN